MNLSYDNQDKLDYVVLKLDDYLVDKRCLQVIQGVIVLFYIG